jgi:glutaredoxin
VIVTLTLYTSPGCLSCKIVKDFLIERGIAFEELDIKGEGRTEFARFYREHQTEIQRSADGIAFPICFDGQDLRQGPGVILAWLQAGSALDGFVRQSSRGQGWLDGFNLSGGDPSAGEELAYVLRYLKKQGLKIAVDLDGRNGALFEQLIQEKLVDEAIFTLRGPAEVYAYLADRPADPEAVRRSLRLLVKVPAYQIVLPVGPVSRPDGPDSTLTPDEASAAAAQAAESTGDSRAPFFIRPVSSEAGGAAAFKYRTAARRHMFAAELMKS